jgi:hypothetical protein
MRRIATYGFVALSFGGLLLAGAGVAAAAPEKPGGGDVGVAHASCGRTAPDKDSSSWETTGYGANQRSGSSTGCAIWGVAGPGDNLDYHCYTVGNDGYTWTYVRNNDDGTTGWVRDDLLADNGSYVYCGF